MTEDGRAPEPPGAQRLLLVSDFNLGTLARIIDNAPGEPPVRAELAPFGDIGGALAAGEAEGGRGALVWTRPQAVLPSFRSLLELQPVAPARVEEEVDVFCDLLRQAKARFRFQLVPTWVVPGVHRGLGMLDLRSPAGTAGHLIRANARLVENLSDAPDVFVLDASRWSAEDDPGEADRLWYLAKVPFTSAVFRAAAADSLAAVRGLSGRARKVVVVDLDDTLWGGIVGDVGWEALQLGGHDPVGEAFADFQRALKALTHRGVLLGIVSKNEEAVAMTAIRSHPEMGLKSSDFAAWRINWKDKAANLVELARELNLGLDSLVFIDDNPGERARVRETLPDVLVPDWPADPLRFASTLRGLTCFDAPALSAEDVARSRMYGEERERREARLAVGSIEEWLRTLEVKITVQPLDRANLQRAAQLLNKTNQMNLTTRRLTESELWSWANEPGRALWTVRVEDRFGDYGLTGLVSVEEERGAARIVDFVLSCRVFGRKAEETMVHVAVEHARAHGLGSLHADFVKTAKNKPCLDFWRERSGFVEAPDSRFAYEASQPYALPEHVRLLQGAARG
jgi:FkbH-like protein